jgi:Arc/MetJ family transcription regulator
MGGNVKTSITVDEELWKAFKAKAAQERGLKRTSEAVEEALREEISDIIVVKALEEMSSGEPSTFDVKAVKTKVETSASEVIREMRAGTS